MNVFVDAPKYGRVAIGVAMDECVRDIKHKLCDRTGFAEPYQRLYMHGSDLDSARPLGDCDICDGTVLQLLVGTDESGFILTVEMGGDTSPIAFGAGQSDLVSSIKSQIWERTGVPCGEQRLFLGREELNDGCTLRQCGVFRNATLELVAHGGYRTQRLYDAALGEAEADGAELWRREWVDRRVSGRWPAWGDDWEVLQSLIAPFLPRAGVGASALVIGCGLSALPLQLLGCYATVTANDISEVAIEEMRRKHADPRVSWVVQDVRSMEYAAAFDAVFDRFCLHLFSGELGCYGEGELMNVLYRIARGLRPGGLFVIISETAPETWGVSALHALFEVVARRVLEGEQPRFLLVLRAAANPPLGGAWRCAQR